MDRIYHKHSIDSAYPKCIWIYCMRCDQRVKEHRLINDRGELVWPPPKEWVKRQPPSKRRKRCRRKVLLEQEPEPFRILY